MIMQKYDRIISVLWLILFVLPATAQESKKEDDQFAKIGNMEVAVRTHLLKENPPEEIPEQYLPVNNNREAAFEPFDLMDTKEELEAELKRMRSEYEPFLENHAPELEQTRSRVYLTNALWRVETKEDKQNFSNILEGKGQWDEVKLPHFGKPLGRATTYYRKELTISKEMMDKGALFICFKAVDYIANVYLNGRFIGAHEGFFAPFELNITPFVHKGENTLVVQVKNDYTTTGGTSENGERVKGDKIFGATNLGYDDPEHGWHHSPAGMGIYQECYVEARSPLHVNDIFVRPLPELEEAEIWLEVNNFFNHNKAAKFQFSVYGQNFEETIIENLEYIPSTVHIPGVGDLAKPTDWEKNNLPMGYGVNFLKTRVKIPNAKIWNNKTPWLYQLQVKMYNSADELTDVQSQQFGMRSFTMDTVLVPKGMMYLNGEKIRLRGANTMGFMQQDVFKKDWDQLINDILLAKICNMNFYRLTQRPVQPEIYEYCDKLGMMTQTDLPLFGGLRPNKWAEAVKQAEEMERLVRTHPCNIMVTYINERFPNAEGAPQRSMSTYEDYARLFTACDQAVHMANPDRVIKAADGDYDPPSPGLPDNHCYNAWYNGHGLGLGELHQGHWIPTKPDWYFACGEFGAEGLDPENVMRKYYPAEWLPQTKQEEINWNPGKIAKAQTQKFHYLWFNTQNTMPDWIEASQEHQAWATKILTESFRRNPNMVSFAIHLFIDAWPAGWMKTIMDVDRQPKKAFFVYRDALEPLMANLRSDRSVFSSGEEIKTEAWICNDLNASPDSYVLKYQFEKNRNVLFANKVTPKIPVNSTAFQGYIKFPAPKVSKRTAYTLRLGLFDENGKEISQSVQEIEVFPNEKVVSKKIFVSSTNGEGNEILNELGIKTENSLEQASVLLIDSYDWYQQNKARVDEHVKSGAKAIFLDLDAGDYYFVDSKLSVENTIMGEYYFVSPTTGHEMVEWAEPMDFKFWYNSHELCVRPFINKVFKAEGWIPILSSGRTSWSSDLGPYLAVAEKKSGKGTYIVCQLKLNGRINANPVAEKFALKLIE
jgi:hypothetical protein